MANVPSIVRVQPSAPDARILQRLGVIAAPGAAPTPFSFPGITLPKAPAGAAPTSPRPAIAPPTMTVPRPDPIAAHAATMGARGTARSTIGPIAPPGTLMPPDAPQTGRRLADLIQPKRIEMAPASATSGQTAIDQAKAAESAIQAPQYHGPLGVLEKIGDAASRLFAPGVEHALGTGTIGYQDRLADAAANTERAEKDAAQEAAAHKAEADAHLAERNANQPAAPLTPEQQFIEGYRREHPNATVEDVQAAYAKASRPPVVANLRPVVLADADGKPFQATFNPATGAYTDASGRPVANPQPYNAPRNAADHYAPVTGTVDGKPTAALFNSATGQYLGTDLNPLPGFTPQESKPLSAIEAAMLLRSLLSEGYRANPAILQAAADIAKTSGLGLSAADIAAIAQVPEGQPTDANGRPIGLAQPGAPTTSMRNQAQYSQGVLDQLGTMENDIKELQKQGKLGPLAGRFNEFLVGRIGADDPAFAKMRADRHNLVLAWSKAHGVNTDQARAQIEATLSAAQSGGNVEQALQSIRRYAEFYAQRGSGNGTAGRGIPAPPAIGAVEDGYRFKGGDPGDSKNWEKVTK